MKLLKSASGPSNRKASRYPINAILWGILLHYSAYVIMQTLCLYAETNRGPSLSDRLHEIIPADRSLAIFNSVLWLPGVLGFIVILAVFRPVACVNYLRAGALVSLLRGIFVFSTSLGPPAATIVGTPSSLFLLTPSKIGLQLLLHQWFPIDMFYGGSGMSAAYLTQDLFFSGHTATTFLFLLVLKYRDPWFWPVLAFHIVTVGLLVITHEHYTIDILGAYFVVYAVFVFFQRRNLFLTANAHDPVEATSLEKQ